MPLFDYQARDQRGVAITGQLEAASPDAVAVQLQGRGATPIRIQAAKKVQQGDNLGPLKSLFERRKVSKEDLIIFSRQMYTITKAGLPLIRGIRGLEQSMTHERLKEALKHMVTDLEAGMSLSAAMSRHSDIFDALYISLIRVGETSGKLENCFQQLSLYLERDLDTAQRITTAFRYPMFVLLALAVGLTIVNIFVIPAFADMFSHFNAQLPLMTRVLIAVSDFFVSYWYLLLALMVGCGFGIHRYLQSPEGALRWGYLKTRLPVVGTIVERSMISRYVRSLALMLKAGVPLNQALYLSGMATDNPYLGQKISQIQKGIERGESLYGTHLQSGLFTPLVLQMISVGEESGQVDQLLAETADFYDREVDYELKSIGARIEPIMIVIMAGFVLVLALGIFLPMWEIYGSQQG